jgi:hypothetical protein
MAQGLMVHMMLSNNEAKFDPGKPAQSSQQGMTQKALNMPGTNSLAATMQIARFV